MSEQRFGILIACSRFPKEPKLEDLRCPENDVDGLHDVLSSKDRGGFTETIVLKNQPHHEVLKNINRVLKQAHKEDLVLIFYSGHGKLDLAGRLHLATVDTELDALESTSIPVESIRNFIDVSPSQKSVLLLDCCYSGAVEKALLRGGVEEQLQNISGGRGIYILTGSTDIQVAQEKESDQYGLFSKHVIEGLREGDADQNGNGLITMDDLYGYVHGKVLEEGPQEPMRWAVGVRGNLIISRSGKTPRKERGKQIREIIFELAKKGLLPDDILDRARQVISLTPDQLSEEDRIYDRLLDQLLKKRLEPVEFIRKWDKVKPEKPALKHKPSETKREKPESIKLKPPEPKSDSPAPSEPKLTPSVPIALTNKTSNALKFGAVAGVIVLLIVGIWWWGSRRQVNEVRQQVNEVRQEMEELDRQTLNLVNAVAEIDKPEQIEEFARQRDALSQQVEGFSEQAAKAGLGLEMEELQNRLNQIQIQLANKEKEFFAAPKGKVFLESVPENAIVKILNIDQGFQQGMELEPGKYHVEVSAEGYLPQDRWIDISPGKGIVINFKLKKIMPGFARLHVETVPEDAMVRILNIGPKFEQGLELEPGRYHLEVAAEGYETQRLWVDLVAGHEEPFRFELAKIKPEQTTSPDSPNPLEDPRVQEAIHILLQSADRDAFEHAKRLLWEAGYSKSITFSKSQLRLSPKTEELLIERLGEIRIEGIIVD